MDLDEVSHQQLSEWIAAGTNLRPAGSDDLDEPVIVTRSTYAQVDAIRREVRPETRTAMWPEMQVKPEPQVEMRPEVTYYKSYNAPAFNGNFNASPVPIPPNKSYMWMFAADVIWHF